MSNDLLNYLVSYLYVRRAKVYVRSKEQWLDVQQSDADAQTVLDILYKENVRSVNYRYKESTQDTAPTFRLRIVDFRPVQVLKAANCLAYQSCETEDWESTDAYRIVHDIKEEAIRSLPGYQEAVWPMDSIQDIEEVVS